MTYRATFFDFDGVIVDTEHLHYQGFLDVAQAAWNFSFSWERYVAEWIGYDDFMGLDAMCRAATGAGISDAQLAELVTRKSTLVASQLVNIPLLDGARASLERAALNGPVLIVSGALRSEITTVLDAHGLKVDRIIAAGETARGKPEPDPYLAAYQWCLHNGLPDLQTHQCAVVEDSAAGTWAAVRAGCTVFQYAVDGQVGDRDGDPLWTIVRSHMELPWLL